MLVLSRKTAEAIRIGDDIHITIVSTEGSKVRIGIEAPGDVRILRSELVNRCIPAPKPRVKAVNGLQCLGEVD